MPRRVEDTWPASKVELWPLERIVPYENNPRVHSDEQVAFIAASMVEDGVTAPILVDEDGIIIYGHGRRLGAIRNGYTKYPVVIARGWSEHKKKAVRIKDNAFAAASTWDKALMTGELAALKTGGYDFALLGFPDAQLRGWGAAAGTAPENDPDAEVAEPPKVPVVRAGDLWVLGDHRLICGDATDKATVTAVLGDDKPNLMVTDPPYGVSYDPKWREKTNRFGPTRAAGKVGNDDRADWREAWALFPGVVAYVWHASMFSPEVWASLESADFERRACVIWVKQHFTFGRGHYHWQHEPCWYAVRKGAPGNWRGDRRQTTVWEIQNHNPMGGKADDSSTGHGTQKPIECMKRPIENNSRKGDHVYDPFCGSGTTIIAAEMTGRKALAIELDAGYVQIAIERWQRVTGRLATLDGKTLEQVARARRKGGDDAASDLGKSVRRRDGGAIPPTPVIRDKGNARRAAPRRKPARKPRPVGVVGGAE